MGKLSGFERVRREVGWYLVGSVCEGHDLDIIMNVCKRFLKFFESSEWRNCYVFVLSTHVVCLEGGVPLLLESAVDELCFVLSAKLISSREVRCLLYQLPSLIAYGVPMFLEGEHTRTIKVTTSKVGALMKFTVKGEKCLGCKSLLGKHGRLLVDCIICVCACRRGFEFEELACLFDTLLSSFHGFIPTTKLTQRSKNNFWQLYP